MKTNRRVSYTLVALQFVSLGILALTGPLMARAFPWLVLEVSGVALGAWALWTMRRSPPNITPDVRAGATLVRTGPYRWIRHPMYTALIVVGLALVLNEPSALRWAVLALLVAVLVVKLRYEERLLLSRFPEYAAYRQQTWRIIPFVY